MASLVCGRCRHEHPLGARICDVCGSKIFPLELKRAMGRNPYYWLQGTAVGQMAPFFAVGVLLAAGALLTPALTAWRQLLLDFGLVGLVTLGVTFPLMKGHYDFSAGTVAGLAACTAAVLSPFGYGAAIAGALAAGAVIGLVNGYFAGWTRLPSAMVTVMTGAIALQLTLHLTGRTELAVTDPFLLSIAETDVGGVPVILTLFLLALVAARVLFNQPTFTPVGSAQSRLQAATRSSSESVLLSFLVSGLAAGLAGVLIASSSLTLIGSSGQMVWMLTPLTAALIGGGSVTTGTGNLRTATIGAAAIALVNWLVAQLRMPIAGPLVETPLLVAGLLSDRWKGMTWYMIAQARRGNLLALPDDMQLPMVVRVWRKTNWPVRLAGAAGMLAVAVGLYLYIGYYVVGRVPDGTAMLRDGAGVVMVTRDRTQTPVALREGETVRPGDMVTTGAGSRAMLRFADGTTMRLYPNSEIYVQDLQSSPTGGSVTQLSVRFGAFFAKVHKMVTRDSSFTVQTPVLTLGVRGTAFQMEVGQQAGNVQVGEGAVALSRKVAVEDHGLLHYMDDTRTVDAGNRADTAGGTLVRPLSRDELSGLQTTEQDLLAQARTKQLQTLHTRAYHGAWVFVVVFYFIFLLCLKPEPPSYISDVMAKRARVFEEQHVRTAADSPRAAALAQMYVRAGDLDAAREEIQGIIQNDPHSEYGEWAQRYWLQFERMRKQSGRAR